jgi:hypothetical protein
VGRSRPGTSAKIEASSVSPRCCSPTSNKWRSLTQPKRSI